MAGYLGASAVVTDLDSLVPLLRRNIAQNHALITAGTGRGLITASDG